MAAASAAKAERRAAHEAAVKAAAQPTDPTAPTSPQTGDNSHMFLEIVLATISGIGICICLMVGKKKRHAK